MSEDNVQPEVVEEGQGIETPQESSALGDLYDLSQVPDEQRPHIEPILQDVQRNVNGKFEQAAEYRKQWQPYEELGVNDIDPSLMEELVSIAQIVDDEEALREWWQGLGSDRGWTDSNQPDDDDEFDFGFDDDDDISETDLKALQEVIEQAIESKTAPLFEKEAEREQQLLMAEAEKEISAKLDSLKEKYGEFDESAVCKLALAYDEEDAIEKGFEDYQNLIKSAQNGVFEAKTDSPAPPEGAGVPATTPSEITSFKDAKMAAVQRIKANNQT